MKTIKIQNTQTTASEPEKSPVAVESNSPVDTAKSKAKNSGNKKHGKEPEAKKLSKKDAEALDFHYSRYESALMWRNVCLVVAGVSVFITLIAVLTTSIVYLKKEYKPFFYGIDVETQKPFVVPHDSKYIQAWIEKPETSFFMAKQFIDAYEGFDLAGVEIRTDSIRLLAKANVFRAFVDKSYGADSNQNDKDIIKIHVDDYVFEPISRNHISVYFTKKTYVNNELESTQRKRASLTFIYGKPGLADGEYALYNPFGFLVDGYKVYDARG